MNFGKFILLFGILFNNLLLFTSFWFYDGRIVFDRQVIIEVHSEYDIPFELNHKDGGSIKIHFISSEQIRFTLVDDENYLKMLNRETYSMIAYEDLITEFNRTYNISYKGSFYIVLSNNFILNDDAIVSIKVVVFEINPTLITITGVFAILITVISLSTIISLSYIYKKRKIKNKNIEIINMILEKLLDIDDESDILDFKMYLPKNVKVAKFVSAFCNNFLMNQNNSYIVFGVKDRMLMPENYTIMDRLIPIEEVLENSLKNTQYPRTVEGFKIFFIDILEKMLNCVPDSCFKIKTLNLNGFGGIITDFFLIIIEFNNFNLSKLVKLKDGRMFIRSAGRNRRAQSSDIPNLKSKLK